VPPAVQPCEAYRKREDGGAPPEMRIPVCESRAGYARTPLAPRDATGDYGAHAAGSRVNPAGDGMRLLGVRGATCFQPGHMLPLFSRVIMPHCAQTVVTGNRIGYYSPLGD